MWWLVICQITIYAASEVTGPWTPTVVVDVPFMEKTITSWGWIKKPRKEAGEAGKDIVVPKEPHHLYYAAKFHPELSLDDSKELVLTYCANVLGEWPSSKDYTPRFVRMRLRQDA